MVRSSASAKALLRVGVVSAMGQVAQTVAQDLSVGNARQLDARQLPQDIPADREAVLESARPALIDELPLELLGEVKVYAIDVGQPVAADHAREQPDPVGFGIGRKKLVGQSRMLFIGKAFADPLVD